jgi:hypothetical protein
VQGQRGPSNASLAIRPKGAYDATVLFERRLREGIHRGDVTVAFRRWRRRQVVPGNRYRTGAELIEVTALSEVEPEVLTQPDARRAGYASLPELLAELKGSPEVTLYRVDFRRIDGPDPKDVLASEGTLKGEDLEGVGSRLARLDERAPAPWTRAALELIGRREGVRAAELAAEMGSEQLDFKRDVRRLKAMGLTISLQVGYRLSPRGRAYLAVGGD